MFRKSYKQQRERFLVDKKEKKKRKKRKDCVLSGLFQTVTFPRAISLDWWETYVQNLTDDIPPF